MGTIRLTYHTPDVDSELRDRLAIPFLGPGVIRAGLDAYEQWESECEDSAVLVVNVFVAMWRASVELS